MGWTLESIAWDRFEPDKVDPDMLAVVKTAALVEANAADYVRYLHNVFHDDAAFRAAADHWGREEEQHGAALARWCALADPAFSFTDALTAFRAAYSLDLDTSESVRGSRSGELLARQVVETGTSSFYSALRDATDEPVLKSIAHNIAADEFRHYRLFARHGQAYLAREPLGLLARLRVLAGRFAEADDAELGSAYYAANFAHDPHAPTFDADALGRAYWRRVIRFYRRPHTDAAVRMLLLAAGLAINGWLERLGGALFWKAMQRRAVGLARG